MGRPRVLSLDEVAESVSNGKAVVDIARDFGVTPRAVQHAIVALGFRPAPPPQLTADVLLRVVTEEVRRHGPNYGVPMLLGAACSLQRLVFPAPSSAESYAGCAPRRVRGPPPVDAAQDREAQVPRAILHVLVPPRPCLQAAGVRLVHRCAVCAHPERSARARAAVTPPLTAFALRSPLRSPRRSCTPVRSPSRRQVTLGPLAASHHQ